MLALTLSGVALAHDQSQSAASAEMQPAEGLDDIVVTARQGAPPPTLDAIGYYRSYCFEANRLTGRSAPPLEELDWEPLDDKTRAQFGISDPGVPAFALVDEAREYTLVLKFETLNLPDRLVENRCTLVVIGGRDHEALPGRLSEVFRGPGTRRHVGRSDGSERVPGWRQWLWTAMPGRGSRNWRSINAGGRGNSDSWVVVVDPSFYDLHDYVMGDLKTREGGSQPLSLVSFSYITREARRSKQPRGRVRDR